jgi:hypothetical protein
MTKITMSAELRVTSDSLQQVQRQVYQINIYSLLCKTLIRQLAASNQKLFCIY